MASRVTVFFACIIVALLLNVIAAGQLETLPIINGQTSTYFTATVDCNETCQTDDVIIVQFDDFKGYTLDSLTIHIVIDKLTSIPYTSRIKKNVVEFELEFERPIPKNSMLTIDGIIAYKSPSSAKTEVHGGNVKFQYKFKSGTVNYEGTKPVETMNAFVSPTTSRVSMQGRNLRALRVVLEDVEIPPAPKSSFLPQLDHTTGEESPLALVITSLHDFATHDGSCTINNVNVGFSRVNRMISFEIPEEVPPSSTYILVCSYIRDFTSPVLVQFSRGETNFIPGGFVARSPTDAYLRNPLTVFQVDAAFRGEDYLWFNTQFQFDIPPETLPKKNGFRLEVAGPKYVPDIAYALVRNEPSQSAMNEFYKAFDWVFSPSRRRYPINAVRMVTLPEGQHYELSVFLPFTEEDVVLPKSLDSKDIIARLSYVHHYGSLDLVEDQSDILTFTSFIDAKQVAKDIEFSYKYQSKVKDRDILSFSLELSKTLVPMMGSLAIQIGSPHYIFALGEKPQCKWEGSDITITIFEPTITRRRLMFFLFSKGVPVDSKVGLECTDVFIELTGEKDEKKNPIVMQISASPIADNDDEEPEDGDVFLALQLSYPYGEPGQEKKYTAIMIGVFGFAILAVVLLTLYIRKQIKRRAAAKRVSYKDQLEDILAHEEGRRNSVQEHTVTIGDQDATTTLDGLAPAAKPQQKGRSQKVLSVNDSDAGYVPPIIPVTNVADSQAQAEKVSKPAHQSVVTPTPAKVTPQPQPQQQQQQQASEQASATDILAPAEDTEHSIPATKDELAPTESKPAATVAQQQESDILGLLDSDQAPAPAEEETQAENEVVNDTQDHQQSTVDDDADDDLTDTTPVSTDIAEDAPPQPEAPQAEDEATPPESAQDEEDSADGADVPLSESTADSTGDNSSAGNAKGKKKIRGGKKRR